MAIQRFLTAFLAVVSFIGLSGDGVPVLAQEHRLFALANKTDVGSGQVRTQLLEARVVNGRIVSAGVRVEVQGAAVNDGFVAAAGGRFVLWEHLPTGARSASVAAFDRSSGQAILVPSNLFHSPVADPVNPRVFFSQSFAPPTFVLASLSVNGVTVFPGTEGVVPSAMSRDGQRLYAVGRAGTISTAHSIVVIDANTGQILRTVFFSEPYPEVSGVAVDDDESAVWIYTKTITPESGGLPPLPPYVPPMETWTLRRFDLATGAETLTVPGETYPTQAKAVSVSGPFFDGTTQRLVVSFSARENNTGRSSLGSTVRIVDPASGAVVSETVADGWSTLYLDRTTLEWLNVDQTFTEGPGAPKVCHQVGLRAGNLAAGGTPVASVFDGLPCLTVAFASTPAAPQVNPPVITPDRTVSLSWSGPGELTTGYVVEAGTGPGLTNIGSFPTADPALVVANVPPGLYYARVRAVNGIGPGVASSEILIEVQ